MSYRLKRRERAADGVRRVALEQLEGALADLRRPRSSGCIHQARKRLKMLRAVLRLVRPGIDPAIFDRENMTFRDAGRRLSAVRDADALIEVVTDLRPPRMSDATFRRILSRLQHHRRSVRREFFDDARIAELRTTFADAETRLDDWTDGVATSKTIINGFRRSYRLGRRSFEEARRSHDDERWHEWRKRTKDVWYHLRLFARLWPPMMDAATSRCKEVSDRLGDDHDLAVLGHRLTELAPEAEFGPNARRLRALITRRRDTLQADARETGAKLFNEKPRAFGRRVAACWHAWRG